MRIFVLTYLLMFSFGIYAQEIDTSSMIIDPIEIPCYKLSPDKPIKIFKDSSDYIGKVILETRIDTNNNYLTSYKIIFAKLINRNNPKDSIEVRLDFKTGNYQYLEKLKPKFIKHLNYIKVTKTNTENCVKNRFYIPITIK
jgi:hypothetical protein